MFMLNSILTLIDIAFILALIAGGIFGFVLFVKVANRAIKLLDICIKEKTDSKL